jgi:glycosyltransferase involved in cell wall biosynthesis
LNELAALSHGPSLVVIVDSNTSQQTYEIVKKHQKQSELLIEYVHSQSGLPLQRNKGIDFLLKNSLGERPEIIHFVDDDVSVQSNYFSTINTLFYDCSSAIAVGGFDKNTNAKLSNGILRRFLLLGSRRSGVVLRSGICIPPLPQSRAEEVEWLPGLSQSFRAQIFDQVRFDSNNFKSNQFQNSSVFFQFQMILYFFLIS